MLCRTKTCQSTDRRNRSSSVSHAEYQAMFSRYESEGAASSRKKKRSPRALPCKSRQAVGCSEATRLWEWQWRWFLRWKSMGERMGEAASPCQINRRCPRLIGLVRGGCFKGTAVFSPLDTSTTCAFGDRLSSSFHDLSTRMHSLRKATWRCSADLTSLRVS